MALWEVNNGKKTVVMFSEGSLSIKNPPPYLSVRRKFYKVPYTNVGKGGFFERDGKLIHTPSYIEVHPKTTFDDIIVEKNLSKKYLLNLNNGYSNRPHLIKLTLSKRIRTVI